MKKNLERMKKKLKDLERMKKKLAILQIQIHPKVMKKRKISALRMNIKSCLNGTHFPVEGKIKLKSKHSSIGLKSFHSW